MRHHLYLFSTAILFPILVEVSKSFHVPSRIVHSREKFKSILSSQRKQSGIRLAGDRENYDFSDEEYDEYFRKREEKRQREDVIYREYFKDIQEAYAQGLIPDFNISLSDTPEDEGLTREDFLNIPFAFFGVSVVTALVKRRSFFDAFFSLKEIDHPLDVRTVRKPFSKEDILSVLFKVKQEGLDTLPFVQRELPSSFKFISGDRQSLDIELSTDRFVIYSFWRSSCVDSVALLEKMEQLARTFSDAVSVISIHSPKYKEESEFDTVLNTVGNIFQSRKTIQYIVQDKELSLWKNLGIDEWPAVLITAPHSEPKNQAIIFALFGDRASASSFVVEAVPAAILIFSLERQKSQPKAIQSASFLKKGPLNNPWGIAVDVKLNRLYVAESGKHRILVLNLNGECIGSIGSGQPGLKDGSTAEAMFKNPKGVAVDKLNQILWVCDTGNDVVRRITLSHIGDNFGLVKTIPAGGLLRSDDSERKEILESNQIIDDLERVLSKEGYDVGNSDILGSKRGLRNPWGITLLDNFVYITAASTNQIWRLDSTGSMMSPLAGSGRYGHRDKSGPLDLKLSDGVRYAQPLGITSSAGSLFIADSDSSSIRRINFVENKISTQFGGDSLFSENLFLFGDENGEGTEMKFQFPNAVVAEKPGRLLCSDTYNHKIKLLYTPPRESRGELFAGSGVRGHRDGNAQDAQFSYPTGITVSADISKAWIVDSGNGLIRVIDLETRIVTTMEISGAQV